MSLFRTTDENGRVLLDSNHLFFTYIKSGTLKNFLDKSPRNNSFYWDWTLSERKAWFGCYIDVVTQGGCPLVFLAINTTNDGFASMTTNQRNYTAPIFGITQKIANNTYRIRFENFYHMTDAELSRFKVYIFDLYVKPATQIGMNIWSENGDLTFSTEQIPLKIDAIHNVTIPTSGEYFVFDDKSNSSKLRGVSYGIAKTMKSGRQYATLCDAGHTFRGDDFYSGDIVSWQTSTIGTLGGAVYYLGASYLISSSGLTNSGPWLSEHMLKDSIIAIDVTDLPFPYN